MEPTHSDFVGRTSHLKELEESLITIKEKDGIITRILYGDSGVGKSEIAIAFANKYRHEFSLIWKVEADTEGKLEQSYKNLAKVFKVPFEENETLDMISSRVHRYITNERAKKPILLIFDNANIEISKKGLDNAFIIVTSNNTHIWSKKDLIPVGLFDNDESIELLNQILPEEDEKEIKVLAIELENYPLDLNMAAHYIYESGMKIEEYLRLLNENRMEIIENMPKDKRYEHKNSLAVWRITRKKLEENNPEALEFLDICAYLNPDSIPVSWIKKWLQEIKEEKDPLQQSLKEANILRSLTDLSLISHNKESETISLHRFKQKIIKADQNLEELNNYVTGFLAYIVEGLDTKNSDHWRAIAEWEPHAFKVLKNKKNIESTDEATIRNTFASWFVHKGQYNESLKQLETLHLFFKGKDLQMEASVLKKIAANLSKLGLHQKAKEMAEKSLDLYRKFYENFPTALSNLSNDFETVLFTLGDMQEAKKKCEESLEIKRKILDNDDPEIASTLNTLAKVLHNLGENQEAKIKCEEALEMKRKILGNNHPQIANILYTLAFILDALEENQEAKKSCEEALEIRRRIHGNEHPEIANILHYLARISSKLESTQEAKKSCEEALEIRRKIYGNEHSDVADDLGYLASILYELGEKQEAKKRFEEELEIRKNILNRDHPGTATALQNLAIVSNELGEKNGAKTRFEELLKIKRDGHDHRETANVLHSLATILYELGKKQEAKIKFEEELEIRKNILNHDHPEIATTLHCLAAILYELGEKQEAKKKFEEAFEIRRNFYGENHSKTLEIKRILNKLESCLII